MGLEITVAKNATSFYMMWWFIDNLGQFDISDINDADMHAQTWYWKTGSAYDTATEQYCLMLGDESKEEACQEDDDSSSNGEDDDDVSAVDSTTLAFGVINFICIVAFGIIIFMRTGATAAPAASAGTKDAEMGATKSTLH